MGGLSLLSGVYGADFGRCSGCSETWQAKDSLRGLGTSQVAMLPGNWHGRTLILLILTLIQWASLAPWSKKHVASLARFRSSVPDSQLRFGTRLLAASSNWFRVTRVSPGFPTFLWADAQR